MATFMSRKKLNGQVKQEDIVVQCPQCNSEGEIEDDDRSKKATKGEVMIDEQRLKSLETQRLTLESVLVKELNGIIKKLNDEVDMLTKQKQFLQSKLREATNGNKKSDS